MCHYVCVCVCVRLSVSISIAISIYTYTYTHTSIPIHPSPPCVSLFLSPSPCAHLDASGLGGEDAILAIPPSSTA